MDGISPEMVLGKDVVAHGVRIGEVVDVGLHSRREVKFMLVEEEPRRYRRVPADLVEAIGSASITIRELPS